MSAIPAIIHLISATSQPPDRYAGCIEEMRRYHPQWQIKVWNDIAAESLVAVHFPDWVYHYHAYKLPVQRADILRMMIVYLYGGFYLDMDVFCLKELDDLRVHNMVLGIEKILPLEECERLDHRYPVRIANYMFGSRARHDFWLEVLAAAQNRAGMIIARESDILEATGPGLLTDVYHENANEYPDITVLPNTLYDCPIACGPASCHFGDYARHLHFGSWRWQTV